MNHPPSLGDPAPTLDLPTLQGDRFRLAARPERPLIVSFLRHAG